MIFNNGNVFKKTNQQGKTNKNNNNKTKNTKKIEELKRKRKENIEILSESDSSIEIN